MEVKEFIKEYKRMCKSYGNCDNCPFDYTFKDCDCTDIVDYPEIVDIVEEWAKEHPYKTNYDVLKETFPNIHFHTINDESTIGCNFIQCPSGTICQKCKYRYFWKEEYKNPTTKNNLEVDAISKADVRIRPKGHWIMQPSNKEQGEKNFIWWKCSECGQVIFSETEHDRLEFHAFCGRCGADMREVKE